MPRTKIAIVEDEVIIADHIAALLTDMGYDVCEPCGNYDEAINMLRDEKPDLVLLDINLTRGKSGIAVAEHIRSVGNTPFIFLTANNDSATFDKAKKLMPAGYLVKPFQKADLYASIEIALYKAGLQQSKQTPVSLPVTDHLFIKDGNYRYKVYFNDINYLSSDHVYVTVHTAARKYLVRGSLQEYISKLDARFLRIHRSYVVNTGKIDKINSVYLVVNGEQLPVSKNHKDSLLEALNIC